MSKRICPDGAARTVPMTSAWHKGFEAGSNEYDHKPPYCMDGRTFSTAFGRAWLQGYDFAIAKAVRRAIEA